MEELYAKYSKDPASVDPSWRHFFEGMDFMSSVLNKEEFSDRSLRIFSLIQAYRRHGHLLAKVNPLDPREQVAPELALEKLGFEASELGQMFPTRSFCGKEEATLQEIIDGLRQIYSSRIGFEYMDLDNEEMEKWMQERLEPRTRIELSIEEKRMILEHLYKSEVLETFLHTKYVGQKRFSLEGGETLIPLLAEIIHWGAEQEMEEFILGMAHRGRLNVLANLLNKPYSVIFQEFEDSFLPRQFEGSGDVKYHKGFSSESKTRGGRDVHLHLAANSSCLESVDPVALGMTRASQVLRGDEERKKVGAILVHGDASLSGQGVVYEVLEFMRLPGYSTGGTIHIAVNNQIGFTTLPEEGRSTRYCTDIAKAFGCPVFHVNAEDPESCLFVGRLAVELRLRFKCDVFIDLNCYRKYGHNEGDEPAYTQPLHYRLIREKKTIRQLYSEQLTREGSLEQQLANELEEKFRGELGLSLERAKKEEPHPPEERYGSKWKDFQQPSADVLLKPFDSSAKAELLREVAKGYARVPADFHLHPKLQKWLQDRLAMLGGSIDWGMGECLAFGSLLLQNIPLRLAGQDSCRGTFSQRHAVWIDQENGSSYCPFAHFSEKQARCDIYNSPLSEFASLAFEYGYTWIHPNALVCWEAQFGDFDIGAQIAIDHYITTAEQKWARYSSLVLLLPHGYEGQGPEHSSARIERFLQLTANNNIQVVNPTTPAQYFHLLRRQALRPIKKPLIVFTPKSLLRLPACTSPLSAFTSGGFEEVIGDSVVKNPSRVLLCSGKVYYDLLAEREARKRNDIAIIRIEQLYPLHEAKLKAALPSCNDICWVQEEPENMGAWEFIRDFLPSARYVGRARSSVTATGSFKQHKEELNHFLQEAFQ
ncbi:MAG: 2-oxoglutarate dehydrogenase E1 component [Verrucomicrobiota bacterium]|nr:2-oxoglutarate dehydrogenase E1 component [Verrucomicrobiota bacterium]